MPKGKLGGHFGHGGKKEKHPYDPGPAMALSKLGGKPTRMETKKKKGWGAARGK